MIGFMFSEDVFGCCVENGCMDRMESSKEVIDVGKVFNMVVDIIRI